MIGGVVPYYEDALKCALAERWWGAMRDDEFHQLRVPGIKKAPFSYH